MKIILKALVVASMLGIVIPSQANTDKLSIKKTNVMSDEITDTGSTLSTEQKKKWREKTRIVSEEKDTDDDDTDNEASKDRNV